LETEAHQIAVWDGARSDHAAGTAHDVARWETTGSDATVIPLGRSAPGPTTRPEMKRHVRSIVVADFAGQSELTDAEHHVFHRLLTEEFAPGRDRYSSDITFSAIWGDRLTIVFGEVAPAARFAIEFLERARSLDVVSLGLERLKGVRIAAHAAPVFEGEDPLSGGEFVFGAGVSEAMLIESRTPPGEIYTTKAFASLAVLAAPGEFESQYVGNVPTPAGSRPLYTLRGRT
ncbi:MAG: hypothetical protein PVJ28_04785, partial [Acidimicrobiia bacterium]